MRDGSAVFTDTLGTDGLVACLRSMMDLYTCDAEWSSFQARERSESREGTSCKALHDARVAFFFFFFCFSYFIDCIKHTISH